ncbi:hypothetical protein IBTHAUMO2_1050027 [Nitrosopumilaceae archaeon]|nr:hypothetical protein IBTHAUMO2_1050027 [Nitrosopumilaceae archaeon]
MITCGRNLRGELERCGYGGYIASDNPMYGYSLLDKVKYEIRASNLLIALLFKKPSSFVFQEIGYAENYIPVVYMVERGVTDVGGFMQDREYEPFTVDDFSSSAERISSRIPDILARYAAENRPVGTSGHPVPGPPSYPPPQLRHSPHGRPTPYRAGSAGVMGTSHDDAGRLLPLKDYIANSPPVPDWYASISRSVRMETDDLSRTMRFGSTWGFCQVMIRVGGRTLWLTAIIDTKTSYILSYLLSLDKPDNPKTAQILQEAQISAGIPSVVEGTIPHWETGQLRDTLEFTMGDSLLGCPRYMESGSGLIRFMKFLEAVLKKACTDSPWLDMTEMNRSVEYSVINHNFFPRPYEPGIPADNANFKTKFRSTVEIHNRAMSGDKGFLIKLGGNTRHVKIVQSPEYGMIYLYIKPGANRMVRGEIESTLAGCGFELEGKSWRRQFQFLHTQGVMGESALPRQTFSICNKCGIASLSLQEASRVNGFLDDSGRVRIQPTCRVCKHGSDHPRRRFRRRPARPQLRPLALTLDAFAGGPEPAAHAVVQPEPRHIEGVGA